MYQGYHTEGDSSNEGNVKRITNYKLRITNYKLQITNDRREATPSPGEFAQRMKIVMISGEDHTIMLGGPRKGSEEERRNAGIYDAVWQKHRTAHFASYLYCIGR